MITIKATCTDGRIIEWNYDTHQQARRLWKGIVETGRAPDTGDALTRAAYFGPKRKPGDGPDKTWLA